MDQLDDELLAWIGAAVGTPSVCTKLAGGNRREAWVIESRRDGRPADVFLRCGAAISDDTDPFTIRREAAIYQALSGTPAAASSSIAIPSSISTV